MLNKIMSMSNKIVNDNLINQKKYNIKKSLIFNTENKNDNNFKNKELPSIILKNQSNNCNINKKNVSIKKLVFNPISYEKQQKLKKKSILSPIPHSSLNNNKNKSSLELKPLSKKKLQPLNFNRSSSEVKIKNENKSIIKNRSQSLKQISRNLNLNNNENKNNSYDNDNSNNIIIRPKQLNLKIINFLTKYKFRGHKDITLKNKYKFIINNKHIQEFKKSIQELYNKIDKQKKYLNNANFVHCFLFNTDRTLHSYHDSFSAPNKNTSINLSHENNNNEINPKYEYINYFGKENKIITRLTSDLTKMNTYDEINNDLILHKQLKVPKLIALKDSEDYRNKNYIKILQKKKKNEKLNEIKNKVDKKVNNAVEMSKKGFEIMKSNKMKNFSGLIKNTIKEHNSVLKKLDDMVEIDKEQYKKDFDSINKNFK